VGRRRRKAMAAVGISNGSWRLLFAAEGSNNWSRHYLATMCGHLKEKEL
jgi:hypothetical protein